MKILSIITINLNNFSGLQKTIESVITQTSKDFEYIIIDGGSTDGSLEIIKKYSGKISYWTSEPDNGIYEAMNKGIRAAKGEYCQFLNSGDWLVSNDVTEKMLSALPDCSIFYGNMLKRLNNDKIFRDRCESGNISMLTFYKGSLNHSPAYIKRSLFEKYGFYDESLKIVSDWKFYLIAVGLNNEPVKYIDFDVTSFNMKGISNINPSLDKSERRKVLEELIPSNILADYDAHYLNIEQACRLKKNKVTKKVFWFLDRILFKYEKMFKNKIIS